MSPELAAGGDSSGERKVQKPFRGARSEQVDVVCRHKPPRPPCGPSASGVGLAPLPEQASLHGPRVDAERVSRIEGVNA
jgi:hypothetical protein